MEQKKKKRVILTVCRRYEIVQYTGNPKVSFLEGVSQGAPRPGFCVFVGEEEFHCLDLDVCVSHSAVVSLHVTV